MHEGHRTALQKLVPIRHRDTRSANRRPERVALWAVFLAIFVMVAAASSAHAGGGGVGPPGTTSRYASAQFGDRTLRMGMRGSDVRILNGILKSKTYGKDIPFNGTFKTPTDSDVRHFQRSSGIPVSGVVRSRTRRSLVSGMALRGATWYGPGFYGHRTACGQTLRTTTVGVANKTLPCGTKVTFGYHGRFIVARVIDRGPYRAGYSWDLTSAAAKKLGFSGAGQVRSAAFR